MGPVSAYGCSAGPMSRRGCSARFLASTHALTLHFPSFGSGWGQCWHSSYFSIGHGTAPHEHLPLPGQRSKSAASFAAASVAAVFFVARPSRICSSRAASSSRFFLFAWDSNQRSRMVAEPY